MSRLLGRDLLTLLDWTAEEIRLLLRLSNTLKGEGIHGSHHARLKNKNIVLLFEKPSTRTRCAFEIAAQTEGAGVTVLTDSHVGKKESLEDTAAILGRYYDGIVFRGFLHENIVKLAQYSPVPVWNGLTDQHHPTQALADALTLKEACKKPYSEIKIVYVGDLTNNVATSLMIAAAKLGMHYVGLGPKALFPAENLVRQIKASARDWHFEFTAHIDKAMQAADVIYTDVWVSMGEEKHLAERIKLLQPYQVTMSMLTSSGNPSIKFMHCLPACHDRRTDLGAQVFAQFGLKAMEVTDEVFRSQHSIVYEQAINRIFTAKAILLTTLG